MLSISGPPGFIASCEGELFSALQQNLTCGSGQTNFLKSLTVTVIGQNVKVIKIIYCGVPGPSCLSVFAYDSASCNNL